MSRNDENLDVTRISNRTWLQIRIESTSSKILFANTLPNTEKDYHTDGKAETKFAFDHSLVENTVVDNLDPTIDLDRSSLPTSNLENTFSPDSDTPISEQLGNQPNITNVFNESTRKRLRSQLMVASATAFLFLVAIKSVAITINGFVLSEQLTRLTSLVVLVGSWFFLRKYDEAKLNVLRILELVIFVIPVAEAMMVMVEEVNKRVVDGRIDEVATLFVIFSFATAIFIAIYGMYIATSWKRTLIVTGTAAIAPTTIALIHGRFLDQVSLVDYPGFAAPLMTMVMAYVAVHAAHIVHTARRQAAEAKFYGQYQLIKKIGEGGMGIVYEAKHRMLKRPAAIKLIQTEMADNPSTIEEFEHEVQLSASLIHWNSVQVYDYGRTDDGEFYYVMEYLNGETLETRIRKGKLSLKETVSVISQVCDGLAEAHESGMIHRDIKPANLFLTKVGVQSDVVKILDFGLAAMRSEVSRLKKVSGTPAYISPEQIEAKEIDPRADIYALGCILYECLSGHRLFAGDSIGELINLHLHKIPQLHQLPNSASELEKVILKCVEKDPNLRFKSVCDLKNALITTSKN